ncbi:Calcipressin-domain-containing protein [Delphinella strobiligena]|nr:Calcipressin-domain-containing protein [Delphinella strobiligena]
MSTPPRSRSSSNSSLPSRRRSPNLSLDLKDLPALSQPSPPSNTLIITNLDDPAIFTPSNLASIRAALDAENPLYSFSPLKSFRRIICAFHTTESAIQVRQKLDGETVLGARIRVYFGQETQLTTLEDQHLKAPHAGKLFFISPPPSPPHGWESKEEDPPNKEVHADDLANALHKLNARAEHVSDERAQYDAEGLKAAVIANRQRSDSRTIVYHPVEQGHSADLPMVSVEDMSEGEASPLSPTFDQLEISSRPVTVTHTARPPVELMEE